MTIGEFKFAEGWWNYLDDDVSRCIAAAEKIAITPDDWHAALMAGQPYLKTSGRLVAALTRYPVKGFITALGVTSADGEETSKK